MAKSRKPASHDRKPTPATPAGLPQWFLASPLFHLLLLAVVPLIAYGNTFHVPFVFDDLTSIVNNPVVKDFPAFLGGGGYAFNPRRFIGYLSFALNYRLGGLDVTGYHIFNLAIHIFTAWLVYIFVRLTLRTPYFAKWSAECGVRSAESKSLYIPNSEFRIPNSLLPLLAALLFVAHPVQTQAVTYIVQRLASLATLFYLLALVLYIRARLVQEGTGKLFAPRAVALYFFSLVAALAAMRTKEIAATLPGVVLLYEFSFFGAGARKKLLVLVPLLLTILIVPLGMLQAGKPLGELLSDVSEMARETQTISRGDYLLTQFSVIATYVRLLFLPMGQNLDYDYPVFHSLFAPRVLLSFAFLLALLGVAVWLYYRSGKTPDPRSPVPGPEYRLIAFGILWFFVTLAVESSIIPISDVIFEHRLYLPSVGAFIALAALASLVLRSYPPRALGIAATVVVVILTVATWQRNLVWRDDLALWRDTAAKSPRKARPHNSLGHALHVSERVDEAIEEFLTALRLNPDYADAHYNLGVAYGKQERTDQSIEQFIAALRSNSRHADAHNNLGKALLQKGQMGEAIQELQAAVAIGPEDPFYRYNLGTAYDTAGMTDEAIEQFQTAIRLKDDYAAAHDNLGVAYGKKGLIDKAIREFRIALRITPAYGKTRYNLGLAYRSKGLLDQAVAEYLEALRLDPDNADIHNNLGAVYWQMGLADKAISEVDAAVGLKQDDQGYRANLATMRRIKESRQ